MAKAKKKTDEQIGREIGAGIKMMYDQLLVCVETAHVALTKLSIRWMELITKTVSLGNRIDIAGYTYAIRKQMDREYERQRKIIADEFIVKKTPVGVTVEGDDYKAVLTNKQRYIAPSEFLKRIKSPEVIDSVLSVNLGAAEEVLTKELFEKLVQEIETEKVSLRITERKRDSQ